MKQCMAYRVSRFHRHAWVRCQQPRARGLRFCRAHANALHGALLGLFVHGSPDRDAARGCAAERTQRVN